MNIDKKLQAAVQSYWNARRKNKEKQVQSGKIDAGTRGEVTGGTQNVKIPVANKKPYFQVDPEFRGEPDLKNTSTLQRYRGISYSKRYELLCRRLVLEQLYNSACFMMATNSPKTIITQPAEDLNFQRFVATLRGHVVTFLGSRSK